MNERLNLLIKCCKDVKEREEDHEKLFVCIKVFMK